MRPFQARMRHHPPLAPVRGIVAALLIASAPAWAVDIQVDILGDPIPDGCTPGHCSLREAVLLANSLPGLDRILLPATPGAPLQLSIPGADEDAGATGDLDVHDDLEIIGTGMATTMLVQTAADRVLHADMTDANRLVVRGLTLSGGSAVSQGGALKARALTTIEDVAFVGNTAIGQGGAIHYLSTAPASGDGPRLLLRRVRLDQNEVTSQSGADGGALHATNLGNYAAKLILVEDSEFIDNTSTRNGGALYADGSINHYGGSIVVRRSAFRGNQSRRSGAAIHLDNSSFRLRIEDSDFDANATTSLAFPNAGGAIAVQMASSVELLRTTLTSNSGNRGGAVSSQASLDVIDSHLFDNTAVNGGGAIWGSRTMRVERSTFEANRVSRLETDIDGGGAIGFHGNGLEVRRSTFHHNSAHRGGAISLNAGSLELQGSTLVATPVGIAGRTGTVLRILDDDPSNILGITNTILNGTCTFPSGGRNFSSAFNNIEAPGNSCRLTTAPLNASNQVSVSALQIDLAPLADNGGPTPTLLPNEGSIAIDQGHNIFCTPTDQRHYLQADSTCDVGAVEAGAIPPSEVPTAIFRSGFE